MFDIALVELVQKIRDNGPKYVDEGEMFPEWALN